MGRKLTFGTFILTEAVTQQTDSGSGQLLDVSDYKPLVICDAPYEWVFAWLAHKAHCLGGYGPEVHFINNSDR